MPPRARGVKLHVSSDSLDSALLTLAGEAITPFGPRRTPSSPTARDPCIRDGMGDAGMEVPAGEPAGTALGRSRRYDRAYTAY